MYPDTVWQWLGYLGLVFGVLTIVALIALVIHNWAQRTHSLHPDNPDDEIPDRIEDLP